MNTPSRTPRPGHATDSPPSTDPDLAEQAQPGYGIPSQDPRAGAQQALSPEEQEREAKSAFAGGGAMVGAAVGAGAGAAVAGPLGAVVGGAVGGVAGALGAEALPHGQPKPSEHGERADEPPADQ